MIVGSVFDGDDDRVVGWKQHDVYGQALGIIISTCNEYTKFARVPLDDAAHPGWGTVDTCDHRTLQGAHDLLAAVWRYRNDFRQGKLPGAKNGTNEEIEVCWLDWLRQEVGEWKGSPHLVRSVQLILANQNQPKGYAAEAQLCLDIIERFSDVPWERKWRESYESDLSKDRGKLIEASSDPLHPSSANMVCECTKRGRAPCNQIPCRTTIERAAREGWGPLE